MDVDHSIFSSRTDQGALDSDTAPASTFPNEIMVDIFHHTFSARLSPLFPAWRNLLANPVDPNLWEVIDIDGGYSLPPQVVGTLVSHRARWEHLKFYFYRCPSLFLEDPMPLLRHLDFACSIPPSRLFPDAPLLRTVVLDDLDGELTLPWTQITSLTTSNLVHCQLSIAESPVELGYQFPDILLPNLESPVFIETAMYARPLYLADFLISAPSLRSLKISERASEWTQLVQITPKRAVSPGAYREAFPSVIFIFDTSDRVNEEGSQVEADPNLDIMDYFNSLAV
ncbi:hypothetical protein B0H14DRAFT_2607759 [Mycena olivaceomarginata]|nr:hypothetical protein B0H14DRAFT_2607759 [Mycena olivaceomarginata]